MEKKQFLYLMTRLAKAYNEDFDPERFELYWEFLGELQYEKVEEAINRLIRESKWFPKIADLEKLIRPGVSEEAEYMNYLDRANKEFKEGLKKIEWTPSKTEAKEILQEFQRHLKEHEEQEAQERAIEFEDNRKSLKKQAELLLRS
jgi:hypothetical protein